MITLVWKKEDVCQSMTINFIISNYLGANYPTSREGHSFTYIHSLK